MILTNDRLNRPAAVIEDRQVSPIGKNGSVTIFIATILLFAAVASIMGLPGADTNAPDAYNVITRLSRTMTYTLSRTPGQPLLDYCNFVFRSLGGDTAVQAWFVLVSASGVTALYCLVRDVGGVSPVLAVLTLALNPFFLTNVGGVGDFAVSSSFLLVSLFLANRRKPLAAGVVLALAVGCRLVYCVYLLPVSLLVFMAERRESASPRQSAKLAAIAASSAAILSAIEYGPSFSFWGWNLLKNLPYQGIRYHTSAFLFKLLVAIGAPVWLLLGALCISLFRRCRKSSSLPTNAYAAVVAILVVLCCLTYFFRVPTKPDLTIPILIGIILFVQICASRRWAAALLLGSISVGLVVLSPYDRGSDRYAWFLDNGWYKQNFSTAHQNRFQFELIHSFLASAPPKSLLISAAHPSIEQTERSGAERLKNMAGLELGTAFTFQSLGQEKVMVILGDPNLHELLDRLTTKANPNHRYAVFYDKAYLGPARRWFNLDLAHYGQPVVLP